MSTGQTIPDTPLSNSGVDWDAFLKLARHGDENQLNDLWSQLRCFLMRATGNRLGAGLEQKMDGSDIVQKSMLEIQTGLPDFTGKNKRELRAWMIRVVENNLIDAGRQFRQTQRRDVSREVHLEDEERKIDLIASQRTPSSMVRQRETDMELVEAIGALPERRQLILELRHHKGMSYAEIGREMGITEIAARKLWSRTVDELRKLLTSDVQRRPRPR